MSSLLEIKAEAAAYHEKTIADLTVNGVDLFLSSVNRSKQSASQLHDFGFQRKMLTLVVNSITGGSLDDAVIQGTATTVSLKRVVDLGTFDTQGNFLPSEWTTTEESQERQRQENAFGVAFRYPTDAQYRSRVCGESRLTIRGNQVFIYPLGDTSENVTIGIDAFVFDSDWSSSDLAETLTVTGTLSPDSTGVYTKVGTYGLGPLYLKSGSSGTTTFYIYNDDFEDQGWYIQSGVNFPQGANSWIYETASTSPAGTYLHAGTNTGNATVAISSGGATSNVWTTRGQKFLLWQSICDLNKLFKTFVPRTEGNLAEPQRLADEALAAFIENDIFMLEQSRRHGR